MMADILAGTIQDGNEAWEVDVSMSGLAEAGIFVGVVQDVSEAQGDLTSLLIIVVAWIAWNWYSRSSKDGKSSKPVASISKPPAPISKPPSPAVADPPAQAATSVPCVPDKGMQVLDPLEQAMANGDSDEIQRLLALRSDAFKQKLLEPEDPVPVLEPVCMDPECCVCEKPCGAGEQWRWVCGGITAAHGPCIQEHWNTSVRCMLRLDRVPYPGDYPGHFSDAELEGIVSEDDQRRASEEIMDRERSALRFGDENEDTLDIERSALGFTDK